jgi:molybdate transport system substrate-binding protein
VARLLVALVLCLAGLSPAAPTRPLIVSAAVSLTDALEEIARAYAASGGGEVRFNFAGSNVLARQIVAGAPVDLFVSADEAQMAVAESAGAIDSSSRIPLLGNRLAVVTRRGAPPVADARALAAASVRRIAIGDPAAVPAGVYAQQYLRAAKLWEALEPKLVPVGNVRAALAAAASGSVDAAIVYETDARASADVALAFVVEGAGTPRIVYPAAVTRRAADRAAAVRFLQFLSGPRASEIFTRYGFTPQAGAR